MSGFEPHGGQARVLLSKARDIAAVAGIQGGKTTVGATWLCRELYDSYSAGLRGDYLITAPTAKILQQSTLPKFRAVMPPDWGEWHEQKQVFKLAWGDQIFVRSSERPEHLEGMTLRAAWGDEFGQMKYEAYVNLRGRLAIHQGRLLMTTTPYSMGWFYREVAQKAGILNGKDRGMGDPRLELVTWKSIDNPAFPREEYERARLTLPDAIFRRRYEGAFTQLEGLVYPDFDPDRHVVDAFDIPAHWQCFAGVDFGHSEPSVILSFAEDPATHVFYGYSEFYRPECTMQTLAEFITGLGARVALADPNGAQWIAELNRYCGIGVVKPADNSVDVGIERIVSLLKTDKLKFMRGKCPNTLDEIETYHYPQQSGDRAVREKPVKIRDHAMDALRYAFSRSLLPSIYPHRERRRAKQQFSARLAATDPWTGY